MSFNRRQLEALARENGLDYDTTRQGVIERGGVVPDQDEPAGAGLLDDLAVLRNEQSPNVRQPPEEPRSVFSRAYDATFTAPKVVTDSARQVAEWIDAPSLDRSPTAARVQGFLAGAGEAFANTMLTPGDVALTALGAKPVAHALKIAPKVVGTLQRAANLATILRGGERVLDARDFPEAATGVAQAALGALGLNANTPHAAPIVSNERPALPPGARFVAAPDGRVAPVGTEIPMEPRPDGSFVRSVPGEYPQHEVRGLLPAGPRFRGDGSGNVADVGLLDELAAFQHQPVAARPDPSEVRSVRPAVVERDVDPTVPAREAERVRQYSGDPDAVDAPFFNDAERLELQRAREELNALRPLRGRLVSDPHDPGHSHYAPGEPGAAFANDVRVISEQNVSNRDVEQAVEDVLAGKAPTNKLHTAVLDAVRGRMRGDAGYSRPQLPLSNEPGGGAAVDDFDAFSRIFDEADDAPRFTSEREPGQEGFVTPAFLGRLVSGAAGATAGVAGSDPDDPQWKKAARAAGGFALGVAAPSLLRGDRKGVMIGTLVPRVKVGTLVQGEASGPRPSPQNVGRPLANPTEGFDPLVTKFSNPLVRNGVAKVLAENNGFATQRRGAIDAEHVSRFADEVRVSAARVLPKGTALNAEQITAYGRALQETTRKVEELSRVVNSGKATDADVLALQAARSEQQAVAASFTGARSEAGRALSALNFWGAVLDSGNVTLIREAAGPLRDEAAKIAAGIAQLPDDPIARYRWLQQQNKTGPFTHLRSYYLSNLLSGPKTHFRNILGNTFNAIADVATLPVAAGIDAVKSAVRGRPRTVRLSELPATLQGSIAGVEKGLQDALFALQHGIHPAELTRSVEAAATRGKLDLPHVELPGGGANPLNWPFRMLHAPDALAKAIAREGELSAILFNQARNEGKTGQALIDRVADLRGGTSADAVALRQQASEYALRRTFLEKPGEITNRVVALAEAIPGAYFVLPFIRISAAIGRQGAQFSPLGFLMRAAHAEGRVGTQAQARALAGTMAAGYFYWLAATGRLSGSGPSNPAEREALRATGWQPNSIKVGKKWVGYQTMQPVSVPMAAIANSVEAWKDAGADPQDVPEALTQTLARTANSFVDATFLSGVSSLMEALNDPDRSMSRFVSRTATGLIPGSSLLRSVQQAADPVVRQPRSISEGIKAGLPGLSTTVQPRIDRFGQNTVREGNAAQRMLDPFNVTSETNDPVGRELDRLGIAIGRPSDRVVLPGADGRRLTPEQATEVQRVRGGMVRQAVELVMRQPGYASATDVARVNAVERAIEQARRRATERARAALMRELTREPALAATR